MYWCNSLEGFVLLGSEQISSPLLLSEKRLYFHRALLNRVALIRQEIKLHMCTRF